jgi:DNA-binding transcriptional LysR family regulator
MSLTDAGEKLLAKARETLSAAKSVQELARQLRDGAAGTLRIGLNGNDTLGVEALARTLSQAHPELTLEFHAAPSRLVAQAILEGDLDAGFAEEGDWDDPRLLTLPFNRAELRIVLPPAWVKPLASSGWAALAEKPWVFTSPDCSYHVVMQRIEAAQGLSLPKQFRSDFENTTLFFVRNGLAASLVDRQRAEAARAKGEVAIWPDFSQKLIRHAVCLRARAEEPATRAFMRVCEVIRPASKDEARPNGTPRASRRYEPA